MPVTEYRLEIPMARTEAMASSLAAGGQTGWMVIEDRLANRAWLAGYFADAQEAALAWKSLRKNLTGKQAVADPAISDLADADWRESYKAHFKAWRCGRLHWVPEWERGTHTLPKRHVAVYLDPGLAFGTGNHETTRLCCEALVRIAGRLSPRELRGWRVIDAGCGSGILAISAAKLGFRSIVAFDNDAGAVAIARKNARRNAVSGQLRHGVGDVAGALRRRRGHLVLANIQADVLMNNAGVLVGAVEPGGWLVLSGILGPEVDSVVAKFHQETPHGRARVEAMGEWRSVTFRMPADAG